MQIGTTTIPFLPLVAVVLAMLLVVLVLWGVRRARRHPAPAAVPGARPAVRVPEPAQEPCASDWTGEAANGYLTPPAPVERRRTVADVVAERRADTSPLPVVPAASAASAPVAARPSPSPRIGAHAARHSRTDAVVAAAGTAVADAGSVEADAGVADRPDVAAPSGANQVRIDPATLGAMAEPDGPAVPGDGPQDLSAPSDERPDTRTLAALHRRPDDVAARPLRAVPDEDTTADSPAPGNDSADANTADARTAGAGTSDADTGRAGTADLDTAGPEAADPEAADPGAADPGAAESARPDPAQDPVPPPWSAARSEPTDTGLEPTDDEPVPTAATEPTAEVEPAGRGERDAAAAPVSRAVQQALAARAVQRARRRQDDGPDDVESGPEPAERPEPGEHPLTVVPSPTAPVAAVDARDRLLSVLLADPARAVGATEDLDDARDRIDQLGDVLRRRRGDLAVAVRRLHDSGLDREQIGRLAGMGCDDVATILEARTGEDGSRHA